MKKILILSSNTGEGHNSAGKAILEEAESRGIFGVRIDTLLFDSPKASNRVRSIHINSALHAPGLFRVGNELAEKMTESDKPSVCYYANARFADRIGRFIADNGFDAVVATHIFAAESLTWLRRRGPVPFKSYFVVTDYSCTPFVSETDLDGYFLPHPLLKAVYEEKAPGKVYIPTGIPVTREKRIKLTKEQARYKLDLPQDAPVLLLMTGSMGYGDIADIVWELRGLLPENAVLLALCGSNDKLRVNLGEEFADYPALRPLGYTDKVGLYMDAADLLITKPGGLSTTEAAVKEIPLVHATPIPGWEEDNVLFFTSLGMSRTGSNPQEMAQTAVSLLFDQAAREEMIRAQRTQINKFAARDIVNYISLHGES